MYSNARSLCSSTQPVYIQKQAASTFYLPLEEVAIPAANYNYNHYDLPFLHIMIIVIISDEDMLIICTNIQLNILRSSIPGTIESPMGTHVHFDQLCLLPFLLLSSVFFGCVTNFCVVVLSYLSLELESLELFS